MDPNATLAEIRRLCHLAEEGVEDAIYALAGEIENLDEWLTKGGFLPDVWERARQD